MACVCQRVRPTAVSVHRVTWGSTARGERSQTPAGGTTVCTGSAEWTRVEILHATASLDIQAAPVTLVQHKHTDTHKMWSKLVSSNLIKLVYEISISIFLLWEFFFFLSCPYESAEFRAKSHVIYDFSGTVKGYRSCLRAKQCSFRFNEFLP